MALTKDVYTMYHFGMRLRLHKWGNSLALRIPKVFAVQLGLGSGQEMEVSLDEHRLILSSPREIRLRDVVSKITPDNRHEETEWGIPAGREVW